MPSSFETLNSEPLKGRVTSAARPRQFYVAALAGAGIDKRRDNGPSGKALGIAALSGKIIKKRLTHPSAGLSLPAVKRQSPLFKTPQAVTRLPNTVRANVRYARQKGAVKSRVTLFAAKPYCEVDFTARESKVKGR